MVRGSCSIHSSSTSPLALSSRFHLSSKTYLLFFASISHKVTFRSSWRTLSKLTIRSSNAWNRALSSSSFAFSFAAEAIAFSRFFCSPRRYSTIMIPPPIANMIDSLRKLTPLFSAAEVEIRVILYLPRSMQCPHLLLEGEAWLRKICTLRRGYWSGWRCGGRPVPDSCSRRRRWDGGRPRS